eukprot:3252129-Prymnesium_polylepis.1
MHQRGQWFTEHSCGLTPARSSTCVDVGGDTDTDGTRVPCAQPKLFLKEAASSSESFDGARWQQAAGWSRRKRAE